MVVESVFAATGTSTVAEVPVPFASTMSARNEYVPAADGRKLIAAVLSDSSVTDGPAVCVHCTLRNGPLQPPTIVPACTSVFTGLEGSIVKERSAGDWQVDTSGGTGYTVSSASLLVTSPPLLPTITEKRAPSSASPTTSEYVCMVAP